MRSASRYLATVRRAMSMPSRFKYSTSLSSDRTDWGTSASMSWRIRWRTASEECTSPVPSADEIAEVKKYFSSNMPRGVDMYLLEVTRLTADACIAMASATEG